MVRWIIFVGFVLVIDFYAFQSLKTITKNKIAIAVYWLLSLAILVNFTYKLATFNRANGFPQDLMLAFGLLVLSIVPKFFALLILFGEDIFRVVKLVFNYFSATPSTRFFPERRAFVSKIALGLAAIPFLSVLYGMARGKYNYQVLNHTLYFNDLPEAFDGFTLTHISDIHSGSFDDAEKIAEGINLINEQESDLILFTGDLVNNTADEMEPWIAYFNKLKAKYGKYSILGNHDYGEYLHFDSEVEKEKNFNAIKDLHPKIGFSLLLNDSVYLEKGNDKIAIVGVENWGTRFKKAGDLKVASSKINKEDFKVLMSHDPSHWDAEIKNHQSNFHLTLSGHSTECNSALKYPA